MIQFSHRAIDHAGEMQTGTIEAVSRAEAIAELHQRGLVPVELTAGRRTLSMLLNSDVSLLSQVSERDVCSFLRDLARLLKAGLSLDRALKLLIEMQSRLTFKTLLEDVHDQIRRGESLAAAMTTHEKTFPVQITAAVHAGENSGALPDTLETISGSMDRQLSFREKLRGAFIYPAFLLLMVGLTFFLVMTFVLPQFEPLFVGNEDKLPAATVFVMGLSNLFADYGLVLLVAVGAVGMSVRYVFKNKATKATVYRKLCQMNFLRQLLELPDIVRFIRTLAVCSQSGMKLDRALAMAVGAVKLPHLAKDLGQVRGAVRRGEKLSTCFERLIWFPPVVLQFAVVGEQSGRLGDMLDEAAGILAQDYEKKMEKGLEVLSPLLTLVLGGIVALLVGSVLLGIMSINDVAF